ncbi:MAG: alpha-L-fucosidase [Dysgonamonadaceae bacterium]|nr:alpha-L-fucosidase [Dysgonamonadaceae bacterium]
MKNMIITGILLVVSIYASAQTRYRADWASIDSRPVPRWFTDAKFGIFVHWGLYSVPAWCPDGYAEWYWWRWAVQKEPALTDFHRKHSGENFRYQDFVSGFTCELFQPEQWAELFREAGAKYVVLTSKHHEGFALWQNRQAWNWNAVDVGPHRDICGELTAVVKNAGLHMGFYYSLYEWFNPLYKADVDKYVDEHLFPQMKDLVNRFQPDIVWADGEWDYPSETWKSTEFLAWLFNESPVGERVVVNDRWGKETRNRHGGIYTTEYGEVHPGIERSEEAYHPWEENRGIGRSFGFNRNEQLNDYLSSDSLIHLLVQTVAKGGNLLLNIGPTADGRIPVIMQQRLLDIGQWLKINGEAIYCTAVWKPVNEVSGKGIYFTAHGEDLYVICTQYPDRPLFIGAIDRNPSAVTMLGDASSIKYSFEKNKITIMPPVLNHSRLPCHSAWVFKLSGCLNVKN